MAKRRILVLDDSELQLQLASDLLVGRGYEVAMASDIVEFERLLQVFKPEMVLTDLVMPEVSGHVVVQALKDNLLTDKIPIILYSSRPEAELALIAEAVGADGHVSKEGGMEALGQKVDELVDAIIW